MKQVDSSKDFHALETLGVSSMDEQILDLFQGSDSSDNIKEQLQEIVREELSKMSSLLRDAIRAWLLKERGRYARLYQQGDVKLLEENLEEYKAKNEELEEENKKLKRAMELKEHENAMMLKGLQQLMSKSKKA